MKLKKILSTAVLAAGLLVAPLAQATMHFGAVLFNSKTNHIVRLGGEVHASHCPTANEIELVKNFSDAFETYLQSSGELVLLEEVGNLKKLHKENNNYFGKYGPFALFYKLNFLAFAQQNITTTREESLFNTPKIPVKLVDLRYKNEEFEKVSSTLQSLLYGKQSNSKQTLGSLLVNLVKNHLLNKNLFWIGEKIKQLKKIGSPLKTISSSLLEQIPTYSKLTELEEFKSALQLYEKRMQLFINWMNMSHDQEKRTSMYEIIANKLNMALKDKNPEEAQAFIFSFWYNILTFELADYGFLGEIALAAEKKQNVFLYSGSAHSTKMLEELNRIGYQTVFLKNLDDRTVLSKENCETLLTWQPKDLENSDFQVKSKL